MEIKECMLSLKSIKQDKKYQKLVKKLYETSFPENEQVPFLLLCQKADRRCSDIFAIVEEDAFVGMLCTVYHKDIVFLWYFAIEPSLQGKGYGSQILNRMDQYFKGCRFILNIEEVDKMDPMTLRRKSFYVRNGYRECGFKTEEYGVVYEMLYKGNLVSYPEYEQMMRKYCGNVVYDRIYRLVE